MYAFSDPEDDDDDEFTDGFYFGSSNTNESEFVSVFTDEVSKIAEHINKSITQMKTNTNDFETLQFDNDYKINKTWLMRLIQELDSIHAQTKRKTIEKTLSHETNSTDLVHGLSNLNLTKPEKPPDNATLQKIKQLEEQMMKKLEAHLFEEFSRSKNPFWFNLILIENSKDCSINKYNSLACTIARTFEKWLQQNQHLNLAEYLTDEVKLNAFMLSCKHHMLLVDVFAKCYKFHELNELILPYLKYRISDECNLRWKLDFKDKALLIAACMLHDHFDLEHTLMPLLLQDKLNVLEKYLAKSSSQQKAFVQLLDTLFSKGSNLTTYFYRYSQIKNVQSYKLTNKYVAKLLTRLIKTYQIDASLCPNINNQRFYKNLKYLVYRRYVEQSTQYEPWKDLVSECLAQAEYLNETFIEMLIEYNDYKEAYKWIQSLNINIETLPIYTQTLLREGDSEIENEINAIIDEKYYKLKLDESKIKFVDTKDILIKSIDEIVNCRHKTKSGHVFVGIDTEWKPSMVSGVHDEDSKRASLIQISTHDHIYLIDISTLYNLLDTHTMQYFTKNFIYNKNIIKVGYGFSEDIKKISHSFNATDHELFRQSVLDLEYLVNQITNANVSFFENENQKSQEEDFKGLSELVRLCFGKPLNKSEQISNWEKRPLRSSQISYAALDAYVLLEVYEYIKNRLLSLKINLDIHRCIGKRYKVSAPSKQDKTKEKQLAQQLEEKQLNEIKKFEDVNFKLNENPINVTDLRVVCDNMLGGLGKELRRCGVDTIILENERKHTDVARIARQENRYALSSGLPYFLIKSQLPDGRCIHVKTENAKIQCTQVLRTLNVEVKVADLFSRCRACNCGSYTIINKQQARALWNKCKKDFPELFVGNEKCKQRVMLSRGIKPELESNEYDFKSDTDLLNKIDICTYHLARSPNVRVQFESIFDTTLEVVSLYYICDGCGHIYWEGPHWQNLTNRFSHVLTEKEIDNHQTKTNNV